MDWDAYRISPGLHCPSAFYSPSFFLVFFFICCFFVLRGCSTLGPPPFVSWHCCTTQWRRYHDGGLTEEDAEEMAVLVELALGWHQKG